MENLYEKFGTIDAQIKVLTSEKDELKGKILEDLAKQELTNIDTAVGKFAVAQLKTWTYSPVVTQLEEDFKAQKATEQSTGDATFEEKPSLRFTQLKL